MESAVWNGRRKGEQSSDDMNKSIGVVNTTPFSKIQESGEHEMTYIMKKLDKWADSLTQEQFNNRIIFSVFTIVVTLILAVSYIEISL